jgi:catecholate siderophore receptor
MLHRFKRRPLAAAIVMLFSTPHVFGQSRPEQTLPEVKVEGAREGFRTEGTSAATRTETPLRDIPQFINSVPQTVLRSQNATTLTDALRNVPGISYAAAEGGTQANQVFYLRGFPAGGDLFIDGVRDVGEYNRDLFNTESVEVLKGPSSLMFGRGSTGGLIHQTSKTPLLGSRSEAALTLGSYSQKRLTGDVNVRTGESSALRLNVLAEDSGNYRYPQDTSKLGVAPSLWLKLGPRTEATLSHFYLKTKDVTDYGQPSLTPAFTGTGRFAMPPIPATNYYGYASHDGTDHETNITTLKVEHELAPAAKLKNTLRFARYQRQVEATIATLRATDANGAPVTPATPLELLMVTRNHDGGRTRDNDDEALINQTEVTWKLDAGGMKHTLLAGLELGRERLDRFNYTLDANPALAGVQTPTSATPLLDPDPSTTLSYTKTPNVGARAEADTTALYVQDQVDLSRTWKALGGLRWERYAAEAQTRSMATGAVTGAFARTDTMVSSRAGLIWQPTLAQSYYVSYGNSYNPSGELGVYGGTGTNLTAVNQNLDPEKNRNYEAGAHWDVTPGLQLRTAVFRNEKYNARMVDPVAGTTVLEGVRRVDGVEVEASGALTGSWDVYGGLALMDGEIVKGPAAVQGNVPLGVPKLAASVWTVYRLGDGWEVGGGARGSDAFFLTDANNGEVPEYTVFDATVAYVQRKYELRLNLFNLADKAYYVGGYNNSPNRVLPGQPRSVALTLRMGFD